MLGSAADHLTDRDWLYNQYVVLRKSTRAIAQDIGCGKKAVSSALKRCGIEICYTPRPTKENNRQNFLRNTPDNAVGKIDNYNWMRSQYIDDNKSAAEIAITVNVSETCIRRWLLRHGLKKTQQQKLACTARRYHEKFGFAIDSPEACEKRMRGRRGTRLQSIKAGIIWCHSNWELKAAQHLDADADVVSFSKDSIRIPYIFNGKQKLYYPDFLIKYSNGTIVIVEIKAEKLLQDAKVKAKLAALNDYCYKFGFMSLILTGKNKINLSCLKMPL